MLNNTTHRMCVCAYRWFMSKIQRVSLYTWQEMFIFFSLFRMFNPLPIRNQSAIDVRKKISIYDVYASISRHNVRRDKVPQMALLNWSWFIAIAYCLIIIDCNRLRNAHVFGMSLQINEKNQTNRIVIWHLKNHLNISVGRTYERRQASFRKFKIWIMCDQ